MCNPQIQLREMKSISIRMSSRQIKLFIVNYGYELSVHLYLDLYLVTNTQFKNPNQPNWCIIN